MVKLLLFIDDMRMYLPLPKRINGKIITNKSVKMLCSEINMEE